MFVTFGDRRRTSTYSYRARAQSGHIADRSRLRRWGVVVVASILASGLSTAASTSPAAAVHPSYTVIDLVDPSGDQTSYGRHINNAGQVSVYTGSASSWTAAGGLVDIGNLGVPDVLARDMNESGQIVGASSFDATNNTHAFLWTPGGTMQDLGTLPGFTSSFATAVNDNGMVVGSLTGDSSGNPHAFVWTAADGMINIGPASGRSYAVDVNNSGVVVVMDITTFPAACGDLDRDRRSRLPAQPIWRRHHRFVHQRQWRRYRTYQFVRARPEARVRVDPGERHGRHRHARLGLLGSVRHQQQRASGRIRRNRRRRPCVLLVAVHRDGRARNPRQRRDRGECDQRARSGRRLQLCRWGLSRIRLDR